MSSSEITIYLSRLSSNTSMLDCKSFKFVLKVYADRQAFIKYLEHSGSKESRHTVNHKMCNERFWSNIITSVTLAVFVMALKMLQLSSSVATSHQCSCLLPKLFSLIGDPSYISFYQKVTFITNVFTSRLLSIEFLLQGYSHDQCF